jgi:class 3 adenylate cyclase
MAPGQVVALLFTDVVDSTALASALGPARADALRREHDRAVTEVVEAADGRVVKHLGDGFMAAFTSPSRAIDAAIGAQRAVRRVARARDVALHIRAGIAMGEATEEDGDWFGRPVVEAARLCGAADTDQILVADATLAMTGQEVARESVGALDLKGLPAPVPASAIAWDEGASARVPLPRALAAAPGAPIVGRAAALATLTAQLEAVTNGPAGIVLVAGEPGIGKSRLVAEVARRAHEQGVVVVLGRCDEEAALPYEPFVEVVRHLHAHDALSPLPGLPLLLPELPASTVAVDPERARTLAVDTIRDALLEVADRDRVLLVLEDLHWAAGPTLRALRQVLRDAGDRPLLVVGTYRDTDVDRSHPFAGLLADLRRDGTLERVALSGLVADDVEELLTSIAGHDLDAGGRRLAAMLHTETSGNAFFISAVLAHLVESGALVEREGRWSATVDLARVGLPEGIRDVVGRRLSRLGGEAESVLATAAVIGGSFDALLLQTVHGGDADAVLDALDAALTAGLVVEEPGPAPRYGFAHALVRQTVLGELTSVRRARLHARLAEAFAARAGTSVLRAVDAAQHACEANGLIDTPRLFELVALAVDALVGAGAVEDAVALVERADGVAIQLDAPPSAIAAALLTEAAGHAFGIADRDRSGRLSRRAIAVADAAGADTEFAGAVSMLSYSQGFGLDPEFLALLPTALARVEPDTVAHSRLVGSQALVATYLDLGLDAWELAGANAAAADAADDPEIAANAHAVHAYSGQCVPGAPRVLEVAQRALTLAPPGYSFPFGAGLLALGYARIRLGRLDDADEPARRLHEASVEAGVPMFAAAALQTQAVLAMLRGQLDLAAALIERIAASTAGEPMFAAGCDLQRSWLHHLRGDDAGASERLADATLDIYPEALEAYRGVLASRAGDADGARRRFTAATAVDLAALTRTWTYPGAVQLLGEVACLTEDRALAARVRPFLEPFAGELMFMICTQVMTSADALRGRLALLLGEQETGIALLEHALAFETAAGAVTLAAATRHHLRGARVAAIGNIRPHE